ANPIMFILLSLAGINFLIEFGLNLVLSPIIERIIRLRKKGVV
ncbi:MAG TPA: ECF transporter S component, partial [Candidatus Scatomorpha pullistercoris]|nr:ECF transporter S component [Candidatus Scatomorpha pullistercoris]